MKKIKKPLSILLAVLMVFSVFAVVPFTASAAIGDVLSEDDYLTFTAVEAGSTVTLNFRYGSNFKYNLNGAGWESYSEGTPITLNNVGDYVRFSGKDTEFNNYDHVSLTGKVACSGSVMSLRLDDNGKSQGLSSYCFQYMFDGCTSLTQAPELPETTLAKYCYGAMFAGCTSLTKAPVLPATTLADSCYRFMFRSCGNLTELPALPATTLADYCYGYMFYGCSNIRISDASGTFDGITYSAAYRIPTTGTGTPVEDALDDMFGGTGGKFTGTPNINTTYYLPAPTTYTVTWKNEDGTTLKTDTDVAEGTTPTYDGTTPTKASDKYYDYTFSGWTPAVAPVTEDVTYTAQYTATAKTFLAYAKKLTGETYTIENLTGETTVAQLKEIIADQTDIPATAQRLIYAGKQLEDAKTLAEYNIEKESTFHLIIRGYTVTWLNYDNSELGTTTVQYGATPSYDGETPTKPEDEQNTYTFSGWDPEVTAVTGNVTYTAQFDATPKPHEHDGVNFQPWTSTNSMPATAGNYVLTEDVTLNGTWTAPAGETKLCLDGHQILSTVANNAINVGSGATLHLYDKSDNSGTIKHQSGLQGRAVNVDRGTFYIHGGTITGHSYSGAYSYGAGVVVTNDGYCEMSGGVITGNTAQYGGGVDVRNISTNGKGFVLTGTGVISNNSALREGGGINVGNNGVLVLNGGTITENSANGESNTDNRAGGVSYRSGAKSVTVSGSPVVANNTRGDILFYPSKLITVSGALTEAANVGIMMRSPGVFTNSTDIANNDASKFFSDNSSYIVGKNADGQLLLGVPCTVTWKNGDETLKTETVAKGTTPTYTGETPTKAENNSYAYDFTGWTPEITAVTGDVTYTAQYDTITKIREEGGQLKIGDSVWGTEYDSGFYRHELPSGNYRLTSNISTAYRIRVKSGVTATLDIGDYNIERQGTGGDAIEIPGDLTINGRNGKIINNNYGSCILLIGKLTLNGGTITNNGDPGNPSRREGVNVGGQLIINGGAIANNTKAIRGTGEVMINGGSITGNDYGIMMENTDIEVSLSGNPTISGNGIDLYVKSGNSIEIAEEMTNTTPIKVSMDTPDVFTNSNNKNFNDPSKFTADGYAVLKNDDGQLYLKKLSTVTWKNWNGDILETDKDLADGETPEYNGATPTKEPTADYRYTFKGWTPEITAVTGDATYTAQFDEVPKKLIAGHSLSLDGNIGINFYLDPTVAGLTVGQVTKSNLKYSFEWADGNALVDVKAQAEEQEFSIDTKNGVDYIKVTCHVCAAEMTCGVKASFTIGDKTEIETYSVRKYADEILSDSNSSDKLKNLTKAMLNYGAKAQTKFRIKSEKPEDLADYKVGYTMGNVTDTMIDEAVKKENGSVTDTNLKAVASNHGAKWYTTSLVYLDDNTLRHYFVKDTDDFNPSDYTKNKGNYYYVEVSGIQAKNLDKWQTFKVGNKEFQYSALDFAKLMINSNSDDASKNLAKALYWYNKAANEYFV